MRTSFVMKKYHKKAETMGHHTIFKTRVENIMSKDEGDFKNIILFAETDEIRSLVDEHIRIMEHAVGLCLLTTVLVFMSSWNRESFSAMRIVASVGPN